MLKMRGVQEVIIYCVNDGAVMAAWAKDQGIDGSIIKFFADPQGKLTESLGMVINHPGPTGKLGSPRSKRFAMYLDDGVIKVHHVSEAPNDPAGDDHPESSCADAMMTAIDGLKKEL